MNPNINLTLSNNNVPMQIQLAADVPNESRAMSIMCEGRDIWETSVSSAQFCLNLEQFKK